MLRSIVLRFRDYQADSINEHRSVIDRVGEVWWGWWKKEGEPSRREELGQFQKLAQHEPVEIGLFDRSTSRYFTATVSDCVFSIVGGRTKSPKPDITPVYYREEEVPAWFSLRTISQITKEEFEQKFTAVPVGEETLFPVAVTEDRAPVQKSRAIQIEQPSILHLSDLHFGGDFGFPLRSGPGKKPLSTILEHDVKKIAPDGIGLLVISGDLTSRADANVLFDPVLPFLRELLDIFNLDSERVIIVPGNHDIPLDNYSHVRYSHEATFRAFYSDFFGTSFEVPQMKHFVLPNGRTLEVLPIHSVRLRAPDLKNYGYAEWQLYEEFLRKLPAPEENSLRVAVLHHHLVTAPREEYLDPQYPHAGLSITLDSGAIIEGLQEHKFRIALHGHQHVPRVSRVSRGRSQDGTFEVTGLDDPLYVVSAGSAGAKADRLGAEMRENSYNLLRIEAEHVLLRARRYTEAGVPQDHFTARLTIHP